MIHYYSLYSYRMLDCATRKPHMLIKVSKIVHVELFAIRYVTYFEMQLY